MTTPLDHPPSAIPRRPRLCEDCVRRLYYILYGYSKVRALCDKPTKRGGTKRKATMTQARGQKVYSRFEKEPLKEQEQGARATLQKRVVGYLPVLGKGNERPGTRIPRFFGCVRVEFC